MEENIKPLQKYFADFISSAMVKREIDPDKFRTDIRKLYSQSKMPEPKYVIGPFDCPYETMAATNILIDLYKEQTPFTDEMELFHIVKQRVTKFLKEKDSASKIDTEYSLTNFVFPMTRNHITNFDFVSQYSQSDENNRDQVRRLNYILNNYSFFIPLVNVVLYCNNPKEIHLDSNGNFHNPNGPALRYDSKYKQFEIYAVKGCMVTQDIIDRNYTIDDIMKENNAEVRRVMIELFSKERFVKEGDFTIVNKDEFGTLYKKDIPNENEPLMIVAVVDSTPLPDGSYKDYFIRVDPKAYGGLKTATAAIASTWRKRENVDELVFNKPNDYYPLIET